MCMCIYISYICVYIYIYISIISGCVGTKILYSITNLVYNFVTIFEKYFFKTTSRVNNNFLSTRQMLAVALGISNTYTIAHS